VAEEEEEDEIPERSLRLMRELPESQVVPTVIIFMRTSKEEGKVETSTRRGISSSSRQW
jgi:hypothetical protein